MVSKEKRIWLHNALCDRLAESDSKAIYMDDIHNSFAVPDPFEVIDCTPDSGFGNFNSFMHDNILLYAEVANTTPLAENGYTVLSRKLPSFRARTSGVLTDENIVRMRDSLVGTRIYPFHRALKGLERGEFIESWLGSGSYDGFPTKILCGLAWIDTKYFEQYAFQNRVAYIAFCMHVAYEICCKCGNRCTDDRKTRCSHIESSLENTVFGFDRFAGFALEH